MKHQKSLIGTRSLWERSICLWSSQGKPSQSAIMTRSNRAKITEPKSTDTPFGLSKLKKAFESPADFKFNFIFEVGESATEAFLFQPHQRTEWKRRPTKKTLAKSRPTMKGVSSEDSLVWCLHIGESVKVAITYGTILPWTNRIGGHAWEKLKKQITNCLQA